MRVVSLEEIFWETEEWNTVLKPTEGKRLVLCVQRPKVEVFRVEDLITISERLVLCSEVVLVPKDIIIFSQFIMNSSF